MIPRRNRFRIAGKQLPKEKAQSIYDSVLAKRSTASDICNLYQYLLLLRYNLIIEY